MRDSSVFIRKRKQIIPVQAQLRFINAVGIDENIGLLEQISAKLKTNVALPPEVVGLSSDSSAPVGLSLSVAYPVQRPPSRLVVKMNRGKAVEQDALIWEISVLSDRNQMEGFFDDYESWLGSAHSVAEAAFFGFLTDDLLERFGYEPADR